MPIGPPEDLHDVDDVRRFFKWLLENQSLNFHPDTDFNNYVGAGGRRIYTPDQAAHLNRLMRKAFEICPNVYETGVEAFMRFEEREERRRPGPKDWSPGGRR